MIHWRVPSFRMQAEAIKSCRFDSKINSNLSHWAQWVNWLWLYAHRWEALRFRRVHDIPCLHMVIQISIHFGTPCRKCNGNTTYFTIVTYKHLYLYKGEDRYNQQTLAVLFRCGSTLNPSFLNKSVMLFASCSKATNSSFAPVNLVLYMITALPFPSLKGYVS